MADQTLFVQARPFILAGAGITSTANTIQIQTFKTPAGDNIAMTDFGDIGYATIEPSLDNEEIISFTGVTQNADGTATLTGVTRGLDFKTPYTSVAGNKKSHPGGSQLVLSDNPQLFDQFAIKDNDETITGTWTFTNTAMPRASASVTYGAGSEEYLATKRYADNLALAGAPDGSTTQKGVVEEATQAETNAGTAAGSEARLYTNPSTAAVAVQNAVWSYAADAEASDTYVITLAPAVTAYVAGQVFYFKANTANTGAATLNVNGLGAKTIKKLHDQDLENNDIESGSVITVIYDGTNFQMQNPPATLVSSAVATEASTFFGATDMTGAEAETLTNGSNADSLHKHNYNYLLAKDFTSATVTATSGGAAITYYATAYTISVPANTLSTGNVIKVTVHFAGWSSSGNNSGGFSVKYGGTSGKVAIIYDNSVTPTGPGWAELYIAGNGATNSQISWGHMFMYDTNKSEWLTTVTNVGQSHGSTETPPTYSIDSTSTQDLIIEIFVATTAGATSITKKSMIAEVLQYRT